MTQGGRQGDIQGCCRARCNRRLERLREIKHDQDVYGKKSDEEWYEVIRYAGAYPPTQH